MWEQGRIQEKHRPGGGAVPLVTLRKFGPQAVFQNPVQQSTGTLQLVPLVRSPVSVHIQPFRLQGGSSATFPNISQGTVAMQGF